MGIMMSVSADKPTDVVKLQEVLHEMDQRGMNIHIIKFSADWCAPCAKLLSWWRSYLQKCPDNVIMTEVDIDEQLDLYMFMKKKRMLKGVPTIFAWYPQPDRDEDTWYIPEDSVSGIDEKAIVDFFDRAIHKANAL